MKSRPLQLVIYTIFGLLAGCSKQWPTPSTEAAKASESQDVIVDRLARSISIPKRVNRIISLSPATTELLFALGLGDRVVGATEYCDYPQEALSIPRVGAGTLESISAETLVSLKPDLVLCLWDTHQPLLETLERLGVSVCAIGAQSLEELYEETRWIGRFADRSVQAEELISRMKDRQAQLLRVVAKYKQDPPLRVFYEVWDDPLMTAAPNSFIGELMSMAGLENIVSDTAVRYPRINSEMVVKGNPDLIFAPTSHLEKIDIDSFKSRPGWSSVAAVKHGRIVLISADEVSRCGPRLLDGLTEMIMAAYPAAAEPLKSDQP